MKIVYGNCCGVDVHKNQITVTHVQHHSKGLPTYETKCFSTMHDDLSKFAAYLSSKQCVDVCMESTGKYYVPVYRILKSNGFKPVVAHPKFVKAIAGQKTDKKDSKWIADLFSLGYVRPSYIPSQEIVDLRDLTRYQSKLIYIRSGEKNRVQNSLTMSGIMLANIVSDAFGASAKAILKHKMANPDEQNVDYSPLMHKRMKAKSEEVGRAMEGEISPQQSLKMTFAMRHIDYVTSVLEQLETAIDLLVKPFEPLIALLETIPGITRYSAIRIIAETGGDMSVFPSSKHLTSWLGLCPQCNESNGKKKSVHISKAGHNLKPILVNVALAAVKSKDCKFFAFKHKELSKRRGKMRSIIAIARMIMTCVYAMLSKNEVFNADLYNQYLTAQTAPVKRKQINTVVKYLSSQGFSLINTQTGEIFAQSSTA